MKVSFIVPCRNKAGFVARTVQTVLAQTYAPMEIVLSDQGSTDGTFEIISDMASKYDGPNIVRVLQCPHTEYRGMAGLNQHLNWLNEQIEGDIVIMCSADDLNHPDRAKYTVEAFERHNPSYVGTCVQYLDADLEWRGEITAYRMDTPEEERDGFVDPLANVNDLIGSSASSAWARDLYSKYGPLRGVESQDILLPFFATLERGIFYVSKALHAYVRHADANNTGQEGVVRAAEIEFQALEAQLALEANDAAKETLLEQMKAARARHNACIETNNYHYTSNFYAIMRRVQELGINLTDDLQDALLRKALEAGNVWSLARDQLTMMRAQPAGMKV